MSEVGCMAHRQKILHTPAVAQKANELKVNKKHTTYW